MKEKYEQMSDQTPEERGWRLVKDTLNDEEAYLTLHQGLPIQLRGSKGTLFVLYPSGRFVKVGAREPKLGEMVKESEFVGSDYLATIIAWIKHDEDSVEENWRCGEFTIEELEEREEIRRRCRVIYQERRSWQWSSFIPIIFALLVIIPIGFMVIPILTHSMNSLATSNSTSVSVGNSTELETPFSTLAIEITKIIPLMMPILLIGIIISVFLRDWP